MLSGKRRTGQEDRSGLDRAARRPRRFVAQPRRVRTRACASSCADRARTEGVMLSTAYSPQQNSSTSVTHPPPQVCLDHACHLLRRLARRGRRLARSVAEWTSQDAQMVRAAILGMEVTAPCSYKRCIHNRREVFSERSKVYDFVRTSPPQ